MSARRPARQSATAAQSRLKEVILDLNDYEAEQTLRLPLAEVAPFRSIENSRDPGQEQQDVKRRKVYRDDNADPSTSNRSTEAVAFTSSSAPKAKRSSSTPASTSTTTSSSDWHDTPISDDYTPIPPTTKPIDQQYAATFDQRFDSIYTILVNEVQQYASGFFKNRMLTPENRVLWREKLVQGLPDHMVSALSAPNIRLADLLKWDPDRFQHGVYLKVAGMKVAGMKLAYVGCATNLGKKPNGSYGLQVRRGEHEATFANPDSKVGFDKKARTLGLGSTSGLEVPKLSFGTLFTYKLTCLFNVVSRVTDLGDKRQLEDMRVTCKIVEAVLTEWCQAGEWHDNPEWMGACSHCCLNEGVRGISTNYRPTHEQYRAQQRAYQPKARETTRRWRAENQEKYDATRKKNNDKYTAKRSALRKYNRENGIPASTAEQRAARRAADARRKEARAKERECGMSDTDQKTLAGLPPPMRA